MVKRLSRDHTDNVDAYNRGTYPEIMKMLDGVVEGTPRVETCEVSNSTFHKIAASVTASSRYDLSF